MGLGMARERVRVANALGSLPLVDAAMARGEISYSKVRAITRTATPATEEVLVEMARSSTAAQLETICRRYRQIDVSAESARAKDDLRWVKIDDTDDGMMRIEIQVTPEEGARLLKAIQACEGASLADRAMTLAESALRGDAPDRSPTEVVVHVDATTLAGHHEDGTCVPAEVARRLCCDGGLVTVLDDAEGKTLDVGRKTRAIPAPIARAVRMRDGGCRFPGCSNRRCDTHHVQHWLNGGETKLRNLLSLCARHHTFVHELGFSVIQDEAGEPVFLDPNGQVIPPVGARPPRSYDVLRQMREGAEARGLKLTAYTATPRRYDDRPDYDAAIQAIDSAERRGARGGVREAAIG
jgi:hypothetical protein